jgi:two-component system, OmpR family, response regulator VicR
MSNSKIIKIFYIEDEQNLGKIVTESLISRNYDVLHLDDGRDIMEVFTTFSPDICVLDVMLPSKDGYTLGREIRSINKNIPIIYLTAKSQSSDVVMGFNSGGNDYLKKPFSMEELIVRINNLLNLTGYKQDQIQNEVIDIGHYIFCPSRQELIINDEVKTISHREAQLLNMLIEERNQTVIRKDILGALWGDDSFFNSRNLDVYITKLREYLKKDPTVKIITLKGVGYRMVW